MKEKMGERRERKKAWKTTGMNFLRKHESVKEKERRK